LLTSQQMDVSGDTHILPTFRNRKCGTIEHQNVWAVWFVWIFWGRDGTL